MSKLVSLLKNKSFTLIACLPENSLEFAKAAVEGGADSITVSIDPSLKDKKELISIVKSVKVPVGAKLDGSIDEAEAHGLQKLGVDFFDFGLTGVAQWMLNFKGAGKIASLDPEYIIDDLTRLSEKTIDGIDAAIIPTEGFDKDLTVGDLQQYITISLSTGLPVIIPTQRLVRVSEVPIIWDTGAKGIMLQGAVLGKTPALVKAVTHEFKEAVEALEE